MIYRRLGQTGLRVSELCLGAMIFGAATPPDEAERIFARYVEAGGNFLDTAVNYAGGASEEIVGKLIKADRHRYVVATKYTTPLSAYPNSGGNHAKSLRRSLEQSLQRLGTDYIDLYWVHAWDQVTPLEELVRVLADAVSSGKVLYVGFSNTPAWAIARVATLAEMANLPVPAAIQVEYNLCERTVERELLPMSRYLDQSVLAWGPLAGGLLSGKYLADAAPSDGHRLGSDDHRLSERNQVIAAEVRAVAEELDAAPSAVALAWLRARPSRPIPILGARTSAQIEELLSCLELELPQKAIERLDQVSEVSLGYPHEFFARLRTRYVDRFQPLAQVAG